MIRIEAEEDFLPIPTNSEDRKPTLKGFIFYRVYWNKV